MDLALARIGNINIDRKRADIYAGEALSYPKSDNCLALNLTRAKKEWHSPVESRLIDLTVPSRNNPSLQIGTLEPG